MAINRRFKYLILRGHDLEKPNFIPNDGELCWGKDTKSLYIGDGVTPLCKLKKINNVCQSPSGRLFRVDVDDFGFTVVKPLTNNTKGVHTEFFVQ